jgi:hypothetical protein
MWANKGAYACCAYALSKHLRLLYRRHCPGVPHLSPVAGPEHPSSAGVKGGNTTLCPPQHLSVFPKGGVPPALGPLLASFATIAPIQRWKWPESLDTPGLLHR